MTPTQRSFISLGPSPINAIRNKIFDRTLVKSHRDRIAKSYATHAFLKKRMADNFESRLKRIRRSFHICLDLGCHTGELGSFLKTIHSQSLICSDISEMMVSRAPTSLKVVLDEEALPFTANAIDLIISALSLHWVNDFPGALIQIIHSLKPDGLFLASIFGENTLIELQDCFTTAELNMKGGISPRISPMISIKDSGALLQSAGFALPVVDLDRVRVTYPSPMALLHDLRQMGETNALFNRTRVPLSRSLLNQVLDLYQQRYCLPDGRIYATFDILNLTGWKPHESQPTPLRRGSATSNLSDYL